jgi:hypothetical protein
VCSFSSCLLQIEKKGGARYPSRLSNPKLTGMPCRNDGARVEITIACAEESMVERDTVRLHDFV